MTEPRPMQDLETILKEGEQVMRGIIKSKLRVTLDQDDGRPENQDALELYGDVYLDVVREAYKNPSAPDGGLIKNARAYIAVITYHRCSDYLRAKFPQRQSLKNKLRYFLNHRQGFATWESADKELLCGFVSWQTGKTRLLVERLQRLRDEPHKVDQVIAPNKDIDRMSNDDWADLLDSIFKWTEGPVEIDDLVNVVAQLTGVIDKVEPVESREDEETDRFNNLDLASPEPMPLDVLQQKEFLKRLWAEICQLTPAHRLAYLLNFRDADGDIQLFPWNGVASLDEIGAALQISEDQFVRLWDALPMEAAQRELAGSLTAYEEKFAMVWLYLPIEDAIIAKIMNCDRQKVINLRQKARERLARQLKTFF